MSIQICREVLCTFLQLEAIFTFFSGYKIQSGVHFTSGNKPVCACLVGGWGWFLQTEWFSWIFSGLCMFHWHHPAGSFISVLMWSILYIKNLQDPLLHWGNKVGLGYHIKKRRPSRDGMGALCSPVKGQPVLSCRTNINSNVKIWLNLPLETATGDEGVKAKLGLSTLMWQFS